MDHVECGTDLKRGVKIRVVYKNAPYWNNINNWYIILFHTLWNNMYFLLLPDPVPTKTWKSRYDNGYFVEATVLAAVGCGELQPGGWSQGGQNLPTDSPRGT